MDEPGGGASLEIHNEENYGENILKMNFSSGKALIEHTNRILDSKALNLK